MAAITIYITPEEYAIGEKNGIDRHRVYHRVNYDRWTVERAITEPVKPNRAIYKDWEDLCKENGISYETFRKRITNKKMTPYEAATYQIPETKIKPEHKALAAKNGISENTLKCRVYQYKWTPERAATEPVNEQFRRKGGWH